MAGAATIALGSLLCAAPSLPVASASGAFLYLVEPQPSSSPLALRLLGGYAANPPSADAGHELTTLELSLAARLTHESIVDVSASSVSIADDPLVAGRSRLAARLRYMPHSLAHSRLALAAIAGVEASSSLQTSAPERSDMLSHAGVSLGGVASVLRWVAQATVGWTNYPTPSGRRNGALVSVGGGVAIRLPVAGAILSAEAASDLSGLRSARDLRGVVALTLSAAPTASFSMAGTAFSSSTGERRWGGLLVLSGVLGTDDNDNDGVPDREDACPGLPGSSQYFGCPFVDQDGDGVWDRLDACPDRPGPASNAGCPFADHNGNGVPDVEDPCLDLQRCTDQS